MTDDDPPEPTPGDSTDDRDAHANPSEANASADGANPRSSGEGGTPPASSAGGADGLGDGGASIREADPDPSVGDEDGDAVATADPPSGDELAGIVDLFGALTRDELRRACTELAFKRGEAVEEAALDRAIDAALDGYLLAREPTGDGASAGDGGGDPPALIAGPAAFPSLPPRAEDLPHIMDVPERTVDRAALAAATRDRLAAAAEAAVEDGDAARARELLDVCYDFEAWIAGADAGQIRERLDAVLQD